MTVYNISAYFVIFNFFRQNFMPELKVVELFCGIVGFHEALTKAKEDLKGLPTELEFDVLSAVDINNYVTGCYRLNHRKLEDKTHNADCSTYAWEKVKGSIPPPFVFFSKIVFLVIFTQINLKNDLK